jgi:hypothetical protein
LIRGSADRRLEKLQARASARSSPRRSPQTAMCPATAS